MNNWFFYFLKRSISQRKGRFILASSAAMLTVTAVTALVTVSTGIRDKLGMELRQYGANMVITAASGGVIGDAAVQEIRSRSEHIKDVTVHVTGTRSIRTMPVEIIGRDLQKMTGYRLVGRLPGADREVMVGTNLQEVLRVTERDRVRFDGRDEKYTVTGVFEKGPDEDSAMVMSLRDAREVLGISGVSAVLLNADTRHHAEIVQEIGARYPELVVKTLRQVAVAEEYILGRIQLLMLIVTGAVLFSSIIALGSTMGANVIERMEEIGLMKAVGATRGDIRTFFMAEAALSGIIGAAAGYGTGLIAAEAVSRSAFGSFIPVSIVVAPLTLFLGLGISIIATYLPVRDAMKVVPARILRGE